MVSLLVPLALLVLIALAIRKFQSREGRPPSDGYAVRRAFQYLLLYGLLVVVAGGLSGLLGRLLSADEVMISDAVALARQLSFTVVGGPLLVGVVVWSRRTFRGYPPEARSFGWAVYVFAVSLTALLAAMTGVADVLRWAVGRADWSGGALAQAVVWGGVWGLHWWLDARVTAREHTRPHHLAGSLAGLVAAAIGLSGLLAGALRVLLGLEGGDVLAALASPMLDGLVLLLVGAPVWFVYWLRTAVRDPREPLWHGYVLLGGVGGGLVTALLSSSVLLHSVLVWLAGEPSAATAVQHFDNAPNAAAAAVVGAIVWRYHQGVLLAAGAATRTEVTRIYELGMAAVGLFAAAGGLVMVLAGILEVATGTAFAGGDTVNNLLAAATLIGVGAPVWWVHWRRNERATDRDAPAELGSPTRRIYLLVLVGVGGLAAVVALIVAVYFVFEDVVEGTLGGETARRMRFAIGVLLTAAVISTYHWMVHRADLKRTPTAPGRHWPAFVLLVGPADHAIARTVADRTQGRVSAWTLEADGLPAWSVDEVMQALESTPAEEVMVLAESRGLRALAVHRP